MKQKKTLIIDYGMGNLGSIANALGYLRGKFLISHQRRDLLQADAYILPGVGAFPSAMLNLKNLGLIDELTEQVLIKKKPFLGICLGMQLLAKDSVEQTFTEGLGWINGHVLKLDPKGDLRNPHVGWNNVTAMSNVLLFNRLDNESHFYFDHGFHLQCDEDLIVATFEYGGTFVAAIQKKNIFATQFHPEKSQRNGLKLLRNFLNYVGA